MIYHGNRLNYYTDGLGAEVVISKEWCGCADDERSCKTGVRVGREEEWQRGVGRVTIHNFAQ